MVPRQTSQLKKKWEFNLKNCFSELSPHKQRSLVSSFFDLIEIDAALEESRIDLALCVDFSLGSFCQNLLQYKLEGAEENFHFGEIFRAANVTDISRDEFMMLSRKFDRDQDGRISKSELAQMLTPRTPEFKTMMNCVKESESAGITFSHDTQEKLRVLLKTLANSQSRTQQANHHIYLVLSEIYLTTNQHQESCLDFTATENCTFHLKDLVDILCDPKFGFSKKVSFANLSLLLQGDIFTEQHLVVFKRFMGKFKAA